MVNSEDGNTTPATIYQPPTPIIFICGPTASGKSDLAMEVARTFNGEIICADSQTIRCGMDIGTAKPTRREQQKIPHHMLDIIDPYEKFTVSDFKSRAEQSIQDIRNRDKLPIIVGGTGLYIDALLYNFTFRRTTSNFTREELEALSVARLQKIIRERQHAMPENRENPRHLIRVIETEGRLPQKESLRQGAIVIGLDPGKDELNARIEARSRQMMQLGLLDEYEELVETYGMPENGFDAIPYRTISEHPNASTYELTQRLTIGDRQYAKKQRSWLRRNKDIIWFEDPKSAYEHIVKLLHSS